MAECQYFSKATFTKRNSLKFYPSPPLQLQGNFEPRLNAFAYKQSTQKSIMSKNIDHFQPEDEDTAQETSPPEDVYEPTEEEKIEMCRAFKLLDVDGVGVLDKSKLENLLMSWGRLPFDAELDDVMSYAKSEGCEGAIGMDSQGFEEYITKQLHGTLDEDELRKCFEIFDKSKPPSGKINLTELRHYLKHKEIKLTDDEIDFLYRQEDYWMLEEKNMLEYEQLISKILGKPTCNSPFLNC